MFALGIAFLLMGEIAVAAIQLPVSAVQGATLRLETTGKEYTAGRVRWNGQKIPIFRQRDGTQMALIPIPATMPPGEHPITIEAAGGEVLDSGVVQVMDAEFPIHDIQVSKRTQAIRPLPGEMRAIAKFKTTLSPVRLWTGPFTSPAPDCISSVFGVNRYHNGEPTGNYHKGLDLSSPKGRPVRAIAAGRVILARMFRLHGGTVGLDHGQGVTSIYIHLSRLARKSGTRVRKGQLIGWVGATGFATGPHLHWQLYVHGVPVNPEQWVTDLTHCE